MTTEKNPNNSYKKTSNLCKQN